MATTMKFNSGDKLAILQQDGREYIQKVETPEGPYTMFPGGQTVTPEVELWEASQNTECQVDTTKYIEDENEITYPKIVGGRPKNIVRR